MTNLILEYFSSLLKFLIWIQVLNYISQLIKDRCEIFYPNDKPFCLGGRRVNANYGAGFLSDKKNSTQLAIGNISRFKSTLTQFSQLKTYSDEYEKIGVQFDERKREDAYKKTDPKEFPYAVLLVSILGKGRRYSCSGSLLTAEWVLTAAHCLFDGDSEPQVWVFAGVKSAKESTAFKNRIEAEKVMYHPKYPQFDNSYDIGLVKLIRKFELTSTVNTVPLSTKRWLHKGYRTCVTTGFGVVLDEEKSEDDGNRKTQSLDVKKPCICDFMMRFLYRLEGDEAAGRFICAKPRKDFGICSGDSGSGLVCEEDGEMRLRGVVQKTQGFIDVNYCETSPLLLYKMGYENTVCGDKDVVSVFLDMYPLLPWIDKYVKIFPEEE